MCHSGRVRVGVSFGSSASRCVVWIDRVRVSASIGSIECEQQAYKHCMHRCVDVNLSHKSLHFIGHYGEVDVLSLDRR